MNKFGYYKPDENLIDEIDGLLESIGQKGKNKGDDAGWTRLAFSKNEDVVHELASELLISHGHKVRQDPFGNLFGRIGQDDKPAILIGTHLDTVPNGGNYDGVVGFIVGLLAIRNARENGSSDIPCELAVFRAEESSRFSKACLGSRVAFGFSSPQELSSLTSDSGQTLNEIIQERGFSASNWKGASLRSKDYVAYFETHIEQARLLESRKSIGVVTSIRGPERRMVSVSGEHSVRAACQMIKVIESICSTEAGYDGVDIVGTVGFVDGFFTGADKINAVPGRLTFHLENLERNQHKELEAIADGHDIEIKYDDAGHGASIILVGTTDHSGATDMGKSYRRDALVAAAEMILRLGESSVRKNQDVEFSIDLRSNDPNTRSRISSLITTELYSISNRFGASISIKPLESTEPVKSLDHRIRKVIHKAAEDLYIPTLDLPSGAGHDAMFAQKAGIPTGMIFVESKDGLSHNPLEFTETLEIAKAVSIQTRILETFSDS
jgi:hydantoinase/carbamoylase family amidase